MPTYHLTYQANASPEDEYRAHRGDKQARPTTMTIKAESIIAAVMTAEEEFPNLGLIPRIVAVEEAPGPLAILDLDDAELTEALTKELDLVESLYPEDWQDHSKPLCDDIVALLSAANLVVTRLRDSGLVPELHMSMLGEVESTGIDYTMIEVYDAGRKHYLSTGQDPEDLTDDRRAVGWDGVLALTRGIARIASSLS